MPNPSREADVLFWSPLPEDDLIYVHPLGENMVAHDTVIVAQGQSARFIAGGETSWFRTARRYIINGPAKNGFDIFGREFFLVNTSLIFCRLSPLPEYALQSDNYFMVNRMVGIRPEFRIRLRVTDDVRLLAGIVPGKSALDQVLDFISRHLKEQINDRIYFLFNDFSSAEDVRHALNDREWTADFLGQILRAIPVAEELGIRIESLDIADWNVWSGFCPECGLPVDAKAMRCSKRHRLSRCPICRELLYDGLCLTNGHDILFCPICNRYVEPQDGHCRIHPEIGRID